MHLAIITESASITCIYIVLVITQVIVTTHMTKIKNANNLQLQLTSVLITDISKIQTTHKAHYHPMY